MKILLIITIVAASILAASSAFAETITKDNLPKLVETFNDLDSALKTASERTVEVTETQRRAVIKALAFYKDNKDALDAQAKAKGFKIVMLEPRFMASFEPNAVWKTAVKGQGSYKEIISARRGIIQKSVPMVHAIAVALDPAKTKL